MKSLTGQFADYARFRPAAETYPAFAVRGCALYQFLRDTGHPIRGVGFETWIDTQGKEHKLPETMGDAASAFPHKWGALAERLERAMK